MPLNEYFQIGQTNGDHLNLIKFGFGELKLYKNANYVYLAKLTHELAAKYNMEPLEMQAIIWVGKIRKVKGDNYLSTFDQAIEHNMNKFNIKIDELKESGKVFEEIVSLIGGKAFS